jgi:orotidine-5'-phosphate decarboxylase
MSLVETNDRKDDDTNVLLDSFKDLEIFLVDQSGFHYVSGAIGPYYIDLRRGPNDPKILRAFVEAYTKGLEAFPTPSLVDHAFVGVPTTGVVYATGLAVTTEQTLVVMEKLNPERAHIFKGREILDLVDYALVTKHPNTAFLGLEDMGVVLATAASLLNDSPSAILRRVPKGHGTSKTVEASLEAWVSRGINRLVVMNDPYYPMTKEEISWTLSSIPGFDGYGFEVEVMTLGLQDIELPRLESHLELVEIEDLWTTGTSSIMLNLAIQKVFGRTPSVLVFLDREQGAMKKFEKLEIPAHAIYPIRKVSSYLESKGWISHEESSQVMAYVKSFERTPYMERLASVNSSCLCVGIDICVAKLPDPGDTTLPGDPYSKDAKGVLAYIGDLMDVLATVEEVKVIKPNLAYYNGVTGDEEAALLHSALDLIHTKAQAHGFLVILDTKIGDISRTQAQYAEKYKHFDAVTVHGYMGLDSISPVTDAGLGAYALVFTSNPSRMDLETLPVLTKDLALELFRAGVKGHHIYDQVTSGGRGPPIPTFDEVYDEILTRIPPLYLKMAECLVKWQFAGSVGGVVGGTRSADGTLKELEEIVSFLGAHLGYLPPLLIPGVGTQGGSATEVIQAIIRALLATGWNPAKIRSELRKVSINSSSAIDYSPRPAEAAKELADEIKEAMEAALVD